MNINTNSFRLNYIFNFESTDTIKLHKFNNIGYEEGLCNSNII